MAPSPFDQSIPVGGPPGSNRLQLEKPPQIFGQLLSRGVTRLRLFVYRLQDDRFEVDRDFCVEAPDETRLLKGELAKQFLPIQAREGWL